jgi:hypothetical protein
VDAEWLMEQMKVPIAGRRVPARHPVATYLLAGDFLRVEWEAPGAKETNVLLQHREHGCVYLDGADRTFVHLSSDQMIAEPETLEAKQPPFEIEEEAQASGERRVRIVYHQPIDFIWEGTFVEDKALAPFAWRLLDVIFGETRIPPATRQLLERHAATHVLTRMESWLTTRSGERTNRLSEFVLDDLKLVQVPADRFAIPPGFRDLRADPPESPSGRSWHPIRPGRKREPPVTSPGPGTAAQFRPSFPAFKPDLELALEACQESTLRITSSVEIRRMLGEQLRHVINSFSSRVDAFEGTREPDGTYVTLTIDWLDQLRAFHEANNENDGLFCLLMNPDPERPGLLLRFAETLAIDLVADAEGLPLGGDSDPLVLEDEVESEIAAVLDAGIEGRNRWDALSLETQTTLRDAVLEQRLGRFEETFAGDSGPLRWPSHAGDLFRYSLQLESVALRLNREALLEEFSIVAEQDGSHPRIELTARIAGFNIVFHLEWGPGLNLGLLIGAVVLAAGVAPPASILVLLGMGPLGWGILLGIIASFPTFIAGSAVVLTVLTMLLWNATALRVGLTDATLRTNIHPDVNSGSVSLTGELEIAFDSEMPTGVHQIVEDLAEWAINTFDLAREGVEEAVEDALEGTLADLPHARSPLRFRRTTPIPVQLPGGTIELHEPVLAHQLSGFAKNGESGARIAYATVARSEFTPPEHGAYFTQVDLDLRPHLKRFINQVAVRDEMVYGGYGLSQNLLNSWGHGQWLAAVGEQPPRGHVGGGGREDRALLR